MTSRRGILTAGVCAQTGKVRYLTRKAARKHASRVQSVGLNAYRCGSCGLWHNGHATADAKTALREQS